MFNHESIVSTFTSTRVICSRNIHFADTVKSVCVNQPTQSEYLQLKLNKQTVLYRLKIRFPHYSRYSHTPARNTSVGNRSKRPHYQNAPTFYQNAPTPTKAPPLFNKTPPLLPKRPHFLPKRPHSLQKRPHVFCFKKKSGMCNVFYSKDDILYICIFISHQTTTNLYKTLR